jgi:hypothetical protein
MDRQNGLDKPGRMEGISITAVAGQAEQIIAGMKV